MLKPAIAAAVTTAFLLAAPGCADKGGTCEAAAERVQQCVDQAKDESIEELTGECQKALENERGWAQASIDCAAEHSDCVAFNRCVEEAQ